MASSASLSPKPSQHGTKTLSNGMGLLGLQDGRGFVAGSYRPNGLHRQGTTSRRNSEQRAISPLGQAAAAGASGSSSSGAEASTSKQPTQNISYAAQLAPTGSNSSQHKHLNGTASHPSPLASPASGKPREPSSTSSTRSHPQRASSGSQTRNAPQSPTPPSRLSKRSSTVLHLKPANDALSTSHRKHLVAALAPSSSQFQPNNMPGLSFDPHMQRPDTIKQSYPSMPSPSAQRQAAISAAAARVKQSPLPQVPHSSSSTTSQTDQEPTQQPQSSPAAMPKPALKSPAASPQKPALKPSSWASLLRTESATGGASSSPNRSSSPATKRVSIQLPPDANSVFASSISSPSVNGHGVSRTPLAPSKKTTSLAQTLKGVEHDFAHPQIAPRGMVNMGNLCFENTILQALVFCPPFYNLIRLLGQSLQHDLSGANKLLEATIWLVNEYKVIHQPNSATPREWSDPFLPEQIYEALKHNKRFETFQQGSQEDAQEFLGFFLDALHEELFSAVEKSDGRGQKTEQFAQEAGGDGWEEVGQKGRTATTRKADVKDSPITKIFGGMLRSLLRAPGQKDSALSEPFLSLQLDIQPPNVETINDALSNLAAPETVNDYALAGGRRVDATKQLFLEHCPPVLILHLKRFSYNNVGGTVKNHKVVGFETELSIPTSILAPNQKAAGPVQYKLCSVIYHHGRAATGGHYTVSLRQQNNKWINVDDTDIFQVSASDVAVDRVQEVLRLSLPSANDGVPDRSPYLLFYTRVD